MTEKNVDLDVKQQNKTKQKQKLLREGLHH